MSKKKGKTLKVRVVSKAKNSILAKFADDCGSNRKAAELIGICESTFSAWLNFKSSLDPAKSRERKTKIADRIIALEKHTGHSIEEIFPLSKKELAPIAEIRIKEEEVETEKLLDYTERKRMPQTYTVDLDQFEVRDAIEKALKTLGYREREVLKMRYGLGDGYSYNLEQTGYVFLITRERVRQIEARAMNKLKYTKVGRFLEKLLDERTDET